MLHVNITIDVVGNYLISNLITVPILSQYMPSYNPGLECVQKVRLTVLRKDMYICTIPEYILYVGI